MGVFRRLSDIVTANVNDMLDRAENPEKMIKQIVREMEEAVQAAKRNVAEAMASQKKLEKELETGKRLRDEWQRKAQQAVEMDREDLAREALIRKREQEHVIAALEPQLDSTRKSTDSMRQTLKALSAKLADAKRQKTLLVARKKTAEARISAEDKLSKGARKSKIDSFARFDRMEEVVADREREADALQEITAGEMAVETELEGLDGDNDTDIEIELEALKEKAKKGKPARGK
ncbi:MAG: hypothetical protein AMS14_11405 [Planctomycetes bacterium DG_20]|nr:MAG: hypothetical protein AMS14_11405 [Planctomycetes bacterium DG_20]